MFIKEKLELEVRCFAVSHLEPLKNARCFFFVQGQFSPDLRKEVDHFSLCSA